MKKLTGVIWGVLMTVLLSHGQQFTLTNQKCYGGSGSDIAYDLIKTAEGYCMAGLTMSSNGDISFNHGSADGWLVFLDHAGSIIWEKSYGGTGYDYIVNVFASGDETFFLAGASSSSDGDISYNPYPGLGNLWVAKINHTGDILWDKTLGGPHEEIFVSALPTPEGGIIVLGTTYSDTGDITVNYGTQDAWLVKLSPSGEILWDKSYGANFLDHGRALYATSDGGYLLAVSSYYGTGGNLTCLEQTNGKNAIVLKLDSDGNIEWQRRYGGTDHDLILDFLESNDAYFFLAYTHSQDGQVTGAHGNTDIWVVKTDKNGNLIWQKCLGGSNSDYGTRFFLETTGHLVIFGNTRSSDGDVYGIHGQPPNYNSDIWAVLLDSAGNIVEQKCIGGVFDEDCSRAICQIEDGNYLVAASASNKPSFDVECVGLGNTDIWMINLKDCHKYNLPQPPDKPKGPEYVCSSLSKESIYTIEPIPNQIYSWHLEPSEAGTLHYSADSLWVSWQQGFEGTAAIIARGVNDCGLSSWSQPHYTSVETCAGVSGISLPCIRLWPNPATDAVHFYAECSHSLGKTPLIEIYDMTGRRLTRLPVTENYTVWKCADVAPGLYIFKACFDNIIYTGKLTKKSSIK